ncbi:YTH-domain-containing protein [Auriculariales sp. MPI-PUGE-AT-0066]|nr:YTH-domain-containing protein [Auriculariales sp. MPI-PUGE-AT-0066]
MAQQQPIQPPIGTSSVRRNHTVSSSSGRPARAANGNMAVTEEHTAWRDDDEDPAAVATSDDGGEWPQQPTGDVSLHRHASLPARYNRAFRAHQQQVPPVNSLTAIQAAHGIDDGAEDEEFAREMMRGWGQGAAGDEEEDQGSLDNHSHGTGVSPMGSQYGQETSPAAAAASVRRVQSLTYQGRRQPATGLKRAGTESVKHGRREPSASSPTLEPDEEEEAAEYGSQSGRSPWPNNHGPGGAAIDNVQRALAGLDISAGGPQRPPTTPPAQPPRFNNMPYTTPLSMTAAQQVPQSQGSGISSATSRKQQLQLVTNIHQPAPTNPGANYGQNMGQQHVQPPPRSGATSRNDERAATASGLVWDQKDRTLSGRTSNGSLNYAYNNGGFAGSGNVPPMPPIPAQYLNQSSGGPGPTPGGPPRMATLPGYPSSAPSPQPQQQPLHGTAEPTPILAQNVITSPIDVPTLVATKGYNPSQFDIRPEFARYFVIKSYTEDDVHKSLKYEIWSSTEPGNKRLDKAFKETAGRGPIYLFFSVNGSGHFCGMAEMLTPVDLTRSSTVWASDKWKGVFKVRWIFVRDIPNSNLRHIRLNNTQERKPVTNSRDTQELLPDAGHEMLRIFFTHPARTSLLQDFAFYELQSLQKVTQQGPGISPSPSPGPPQQMHQQHQHQQYQQQGGFAGGNQNYLGGVAVGGGGYVGQQQLPLPGGPQNIMAQMGMPIGPIGSPYSNPQTIQSVMRNPSPAPVQQGGYVNLHQGHY